LNALYRREPALSQLDFDPAGFEWIDCNDAAQSVISLLRRGRSPEDTIIVVCNFTPVPRHNYRVGSPTGGFWRELLNSDAWQYWGSGQGNMGGVEAVPIPMHGRPYSLTITVPPLGIVFLKADGPQPSNDAH
jgi:1,4-alpha-glucan branching enzyme